MNRDLDLILQHLTRERSKHLGQAHRIAAGSSNPAEYVAIVSEAKAAALIGKLIDDVKELDRDAGEFIKKNLQ